MLSEIFLKKYLIEPFDGGFNIEYLKEIDGKKLHYKINNTMMLVYLNKSLKSGEQLEFKIKWNYLINNLIDNIVELENELFDKLGSEIFNFTNSLLNFFSRIIGFFNFQLINFNDLA